MKYWLELYYFWFYEFLVFFIILFLLIHWLTCLQKVIAFWGLEKHQQIFFRIELGTYLKLPTCRNGKVFHRKCVFPIGITGFLLLNLSFIISCLHVATSESLTMKGWYVKFLPFSGQVWIFISIACLSAFPNLSDLRSRSPHFYCPHHHRNYIFIDRIKTYPGNRISSLSRAEKVKWLQKMVWGL